MKNIVLSAAAFSCLVLANPSAFAAGHEASPAPTGAEEQDTVSLRVPLFSPRFSSVEIASVNDDVITLADFKESVGSLHTGMSGDGKTAKVDYQALLSRLINVKLLLQEAGNIGLDELPEVREAVDAYGRTALIEELQREKTKDVKADEHEVGMIYRELVREYMMSSVLFEKEADAREFEGGVRAGGQFDELVARAVAAGRARGERSDEYRKPEAFLPQIAAEASAMEKGAVSKVIPVTAGFALFRIEDIRYPDDPAAREAARQQVLRRERAKALEAYNRSLAKKYVKLDKGVYDSVDYEKGKIEKLLKDKRVIARIKDGKPVTVAELTEALERRFYHGAGGQRGAKRMNEKKRSILEEIFAKRFLRLEALREKLDRKAAYAERVREYRDSALFNTFIQKVVLPDVRLTNEEIRDYYDKHGAEFSFPAMIRIKALAFARGADAEAAREKLVRGTDFQWLSENAEGRVGKEKKDPLGLGAELLVVTELPEDIAKAVEGARADDARLYRGRDGLSYVLFIPEVVPAKPQPYEDVQELIAKKLYSDKLNKTVEEWASRLRKASDVKVYVTGFNQ